MMQKPTFADAFQVLLLQLATDGRDKLLLGDSIARVQKACPPFLIGEEFPSVYLEFPFLGEPFLDVTILYNKLAAGERIDSTAAAGTQPILDWFASVCDASGKISMGFELDTKNPVLAQAGVHFQPREKVELVEPFCTAAGEPGRARLYLEQAERMPDGWPLSFFGMFRGRPDSPLRACGYLDNSEKEACASDPNHLACAFDAIGFSSYDEAMLKDICKIMSEAPDCVDFQFDILADGSLSDIFAIDVQFGIEQPAAICESFATGPIAKVMELLESMGAADERWHYAADAAFARALPMQRDDGTIGRFSFTLMPQWLKVRWKAGVLQPAKLYYLGNASFINNEPAQ